MSKYTVQDLDLLSEHEAEAEAEATSINTIYTASYKWGPHIAGGASKRYSEIGPWAKQVLQL